MERATNVMFLKSDEKVRATDSQPAEQVSA